MSEIKRRNSAYKKICSVCKEQYRDLGMHNPPYVCRSCAKERAEKFVKEYEGTVVAAAVKIGLKMVKK